MSYDRQCSSCGGFCGRGGCKRENMKPPARKPLTDEEISAIVQSMSSYTWDAHMLARAVERAHGITE